MMSVPLHILSVHLMFWLFAGSTNTPAFAENVSVAVSSVSFLMAVDMTGDFFWLGSSII
jgi:hypothetical protein